MRAGSLRDTIFVLKPVRATNAYGEATTAWERVGAWRAERSQAKGWLSEEASEHFADIRATFLVRDAHRAEPGWRVQADGVLYEITSAIRNRARGILTLECAKINL